jgi:hypothetical protein
MASREWGKDGRVRAKEYYIGLAAEIGRQRGIDICRVETRSKAAAICWFCQNCPQLTELSFDDLVEGAMNLLLSDDAGRPPLTNPFMLTPRQRATANQLAGPRRRPQQPRAPPLWEDLPGG